MTAPKDLDRDRANAVYDADLLPLNLPTREQDGAANQWPGIIAIIGAIVIACILICAVSGCTDATGAQQEAEDTAMDVQDAETAAMQAHLDAKCGHLTGRAGMQCALAELQRIQPDRWTAEDVRHGNQAAELVGSTE
ncbi:hypothetical protein [Brachymonas sp.]|uniref:hypothetical protein n=1 Tax=Brachymonas sp. TaxID=1936292 RepID=UPI0035B0C91E